MVAPTSPMMMGWPARSAGDAGIPARYVIAPDGIIAYGEVNPDYTHRPEPSDLFPTLERLQRLAR